MRLSVLLLSFVGVAVAGEGFIKLDLHTNSRTRLRKRQTDTDDLDQQLVGDPSRTVSQSLSKRLPDPSLFEFKV
jgi:hypothetical protein